MRQRRTTGKSIHWAWVERPVDPTADHFELRYGSAAESDWNAWVRVARVGAPVDRVFGIEFILDRKDPASVPMISAVCREVDFYLVTKGERNPWAYAQYHCGTAANLYSSVHWSFQPGERTKRPAGNAEQEDLTLTAVKKAAMTRKRKSAAARTVVTQRRRGTGKKAALSRKQPKAGSRKAAGTRKRRTGARKD